MQEELVKTYKKENLTIKAVALSTTKILVLPETKK